MLKLSSFLFAFGLLISFSSCQKQLGGSNGNGGNPSGNFKAKIDGNWWIANQTASANKTFGFISLNGESSDKKAVRILLLDSGVHNYTVAQNSINSAIYMDSSTATIKTFSSAQSSTPGHVSISSIDTSAKTISGTFSFKAHSQSDTTEKDFTEGSFTNIPYTTNLPIGNNPNDTFKVKISGSLWTAPTVIGLSGTGQLILTGSDPVAMKSVVLTMPSNVTVGTYSFNITTGTYIGVYVPDADPTHIRVSSLGTLTILENNTTTKHIRGSFFFTASDIQNPLNFVPLTEGYFSLTYN